MAERSESFSKNPRRQWFAVLTFLNRFNQSSASLYDSTYLSPENLALSITPIELSYVSAIVVRCCRAEDLEKKSMGAEASKRSTTEKWLPPSTCSGTAYCLRCSEKAFNLPWCIRILRTRDARNVPQGPQRRSDTTSEVSPQRPRRIATAPEPSRPVS